LFLTANADTVYFWGNLDLSNGPLVVETPPKVLGSLMISGSDGLQISGLRAPTKDKVVNTCWSVRDTRVRSLKVDISFADHA